MTATLKRYMLLGCYFVATDKLGPVYFDTIHDALQGVIRLKAMGYVAQIHKNPNPIHVEI